MGAKKLTDFKPISLIGSVYKIISKVLTERLKKVMHKLVDTQQLAFIKGRQIMDAILMANDVWILGLEARCQAFYASWTFGKHMTISTGIFCWRPYLKEVLEVDG